MNGASLYEMYGVGFEFWGYIRYMAYSTNAVNSSSSSR